MSSSTPSPAQGWDVRWVESLAPDGRSLTAARELLRTRPFDHVDVTGGGGEWVAGCRGLTGEYRVRVRRPGHGTFDTDCTCPSRKHPCKHALALLLHLARDPGRRPQAAAPPPPPSRDFEALLCGVFAAPDDDTVRLVFADCLDDVGQAERAALIRLGCERARRQSAGEDVDELVRQEERLQEAFREPLRGLIPRDVRLFEMERGFARLKLDSSVLRDPDALPVRFLDLFREGWVESVAVIGLSWQGSREGLRWLRHAGRVDLSAVELPDEEVFIAATEFLAGCGTGRACEVRTHPLNLGLYRAYRGERPLKHGRGIDTGRPTFHDLSAAGMRALLGSGRLGGVKELALQGGVGDEGAALLAGSEALAGLERLVLGGTEIGPAGAAALGGSSRVGNLRHLDLGQTPLGDAGLEALLDGGGLAGLTSLDLAGTGISDTGLTALTARTDFPHLETLNLEDNQVSGEALAALLAAPHWPALCWVGVSGCPIDSGTWLRLVHGGHPRPELTVMFGALRVRRLQGSKGLGLAVSGERDSLEKLLEQAGSPDGVCVCLNHLTLDADLLQQVLALVPAGRLRGLDLTAAGLGDAEVPMLLEALRDVRPEVLILQDNLVRVRGAMLLARSPLLSGVRLLDLSRNPLGPAGVDVLTSSPHLGRLQRLVLDGLNLTPRECEAFRKRLGERLVY